MSGRNTVGASGWTIADRVGTAVLMATQCAIFVMIVILVPGSDRAFDPANGGAILIGSGVVAIGGPVVIAVTIGLVCRAYYRDRASFAIPLAGILALIVMYIFPIILVTAIRN